MLGETIKIPLYSEREERSFDSASGALGFGLACTDIRDIICQEPLIHRRSGSRGFRYAWGAFGLSSAILFGLGGYCDLCPYVLVSTLGLGLSGGNIGVQRAVKTELQLCNSPSNPRIAFSAFHLKQTL